MGFLPVDPVVQAESIKDTVCKPSAEVKIINTLPSGFIAYGVDNIEVRALTLGELKYLSSEGITKKNLVDLYRGIILNYDIDKLTWSDFSFIVAHIAIFTMKSIAWTFQDVCVSCGRPMQIKLTRDKFVEFEDTSNLKGYPIIVTVAGREMEFGFLTVAKYLEVLEDIPQIEDHLKSLYILSAMVNNMETPEAFEILKGITDYEDSALIVRVAELLYHDSLPVEWKCEHCGHTDKYKVDAEVSTVSPFRDNGESIDARISFGKRLK